ncbi:MAG: hypothetical protein ACX94C_11680 [Phycisphaerales bacterium]
MGTKELIVTSVYAHESTPDEMRVGFSCDSPDDVGASEWVEVVDRDGMQVVRGLVAADVDPEKPSLVLRAGRVPLVDLSVGVRPGYRLVLHDTAPDDADLAPEPEIPLYQCHKKVGALKIESARVLPRGTQLRFTDERFGPRTMPKGWGEKHRPKAGGYLVFYTSGYVSYSPAEAFEDGYTLIEGA